MSSEWQVVDTLQKKKEKLKQKRSENAIENAEKQKKRMEESREKEAELKRLGLGFSISDVSSDNAKKKKAKGKGKHGKPIQSIYDIDIPADEVPKKDRTEKKKNKEPKQPKAPKEPKEFKDKSGQTLASACESLDADVLHAELNSVEMQYAALPLVQLQKLTELLESSFPKIRAFTKHEEGHLYRRIQSPIRTLQERNEKVFDLLRDWIGDRPISSEFVSFLVDLIVEGASQGVAVRILLSLIARYHPQKIVAESSYIFTKLPLRTSTWIFLQTMYADPDLAMLLWVKHFLPQAYNAQKENSEAVVYLSCLFTYIRKKGHKINVPMHADDLATELGKFLTVVATSSGKSFAALKEHYYELLDSAFMSSGDPRDFFVEMLRLTSSDVEEVSHAAFDVLVYNLKTNTDLFQIWKEIYADHVIETNNVLVYILHNYEGIQTSTLPPIPREPHTYASDASSGEDESDEEEERTKKGSKIREFGATMELNGKTIIASRKPAGPARARPIPVRELTMLLTRVEEVNAQLASAPKSKGKGKEKGSTVSKQSLETCNATCRALRATVAQSRSGRDAGGGEGVGCMGTLVKLTIAVAGLAGLMAFALRHSNPEVLDKILIF